MSKSDYKGKTSSLKSTEVPKYDPEMEFSDYAADCVSFVIDHLPTFFRDHERYELSSHIEETLFSDCDYNNPTKPTSENITRILNELRIVFGFDSDYNSTVISFYDGFPESTQ